MPAEAKFSFHRKWKDEQTIARRVAGVVISFDDTVSLRDKTWNVGTGNDWKLYVDMETRTATLAYRYGTNELMNSFSDVLNWIFQ